MNSKIVAAIIGTALSAFVSLGQGTIGFANSTLTRVQWLSSPGIYQNLPVGAPIVFGVFWGTMADDLHLNDGPLGTASTTSSGLIQAPATYALVGTDPAGGETYFMKIAGWSSQYGRDYAAAKLDPAARYGETAVRQITTASSLGPGTVIWSGSNTSLFQPLKLDIVPEPSVVVLGVLGSGVLLLRRKRA